MSPLNELLQRQFVITGSVYCWELSTSQHWIYKISLDMMIVQQDIFKIRNNEYELGTIKEKMNLLTHFQHNDYQPGLVASVILILWYHFFANIKIRQVNKNSSISIPGEWKHTKAAWLTGRYNTKSSKKTR